MSRRFLWMLPAIALVAGLAWYSSYLAANRIYQVDECQNLYMAKVLAAGQTSDFFTNASLFLLGPLSWITKASDRSETIFALGRLLFLAVFWLNLLLLANIAGKRLRSVEGLIALAGAATLAPLWDYGFEIRHDNIILTGVLLIWWAVRARPMGVLSYMLAGALAVALLFIAVKSVVYVLPVSLIVLAFPSPAHRRSRMQLALAWAGGAVLALLAIRLCYGTGGKWEAYLAVFRGIAKYSAGTEGGGRFAPWFTLNRLPNQIPLLLALTFAAGFAVLADLWKRKRVAVTWDGNLPEFLLVGIAMAGLFLNPTPFPYNVVHLVPYLFLLAFRYGKQLWSELQLKTNLWPALAAIVIFAHLVPFGVSAKRHVDFTNFRQKNLMHLAEDLTESEKDPVYDGIGMVVSRRSIDFNWYLHSLNIRSFTSGPGPKLHDMLAVRPAPVFIPSYRTDWLPKEDHDFIRSRYVPLADDFWVLGKELPPGGGDMEIFHPGRYWIASPENLDGSTSSESDHCAATVDGVPVTQPVELKLGIHRIEATPKSKLTVVWVGPKMAQVNPIGDRDHRALFVNWY